jgi:4a-hydroxytetrahydrobiopterin dehydratase
MATTIDALAALPCVRNAALLSEAALNDALAALPGWARVADRIAKTFRFANYHETLAFVNAVAWISHRADHHPDLSVHYNRCVVSWSTHDAGGITQNDLACAARVERLLA